MSLPPQPPTYGPPPTSGGQGSDRSLLTIIAIFSAITALGVIVGVGIWGYSWWQSQRMLDRLTSTVTDTSALPDLTGTWTGKFVYPGGSVSKVTLDVDSGDPVTGTMTFHTGDCVVSVRETASTDTTLSFDTTSTDDDPQRCAAWGKWKVDVNRYAVDGTLVDSAYPQLNGSSLKLSRSND